MSTGEKEENLSVPVLLTVNPVMSALTFWKVPFYQEEMDNIPDDAICLDVRKKTNTKADIFQDLLTYR